MVQMTDADNAYTAWGLLKRKSKLELSDDDLFIYFFNRLAGETECKNRNCSCLLILVDEFARKAVARYLVMFKCKTKYEQDSIVLEWFRYLTLAERGGNSQGPKKEERTTTTCHMMAITLMTTTVFRLREPMVAQWAKVKVERADQVEFWAAKKRKKYATAEMIERIASNDEAEMMDGDGGK